MLHSLIEEVPFAALVADDQGLYAMTNHAASAYAARAHVLHERHISLLSPVASTLMQERGTPARGVPRTWEGGYGTPWKQARHGCRLRACSRINPSRGRTKPTPDHDAREHDEHDDDEHRHRPTVARRTIRNLQGVSERRPL